MSEGQPKYILTQDTVGLFSQATSTDLSTNEGFCNESETYFRRIAWTLSQSLGSVAETVLFSENEISEKLTEKVTTILQNDSEAVCICLDRYLLQSLETNREYLNRFFRFSICRTVAGQQVPRQKGKPFSEQIQEIKKAVPDIERKKVIVVDDGIFSGGTVRDFIKTATENGVRFSVSKIIGFIGNNNIRFGNDFPTVEISEPIPDLYDWIDIRDFSPLGGKRLSTSRSNRINSSVPYLFPWSYGEDASINLSPNLLSDSTKLIEAFKDLVLKYEKSTGKRSLTFRELMKSGFPLPTNLGKTIPISINDAVVDYLDRCLGLIKREQERFVYVFDMDGTLYQLNGLNNGYSGSTLERTVLQNALSFIQNKEKCSKEKAEVILQEALKDPVGISVFLSNRYGIMRVNYFNEVWNINPQDILQNYEISVQTIQTLIKQFPERKFILLTSAPRIWVERVLKYLGIRKCFEILFTGEQFGSKQEIFKVLAGWYRKENIISVGDQNETDIVPAEKIGIKGLKIDKPDDASLLTNSDVLTKK